MLWSSAARQPLNQEGNCSGLMDIAVKSLAGGSRLCYCERTTQIFVSIYLPQAMPRVLPSQRRRHRLLCLFFGYKREVVIFYDKAMCRQLETGRHCYPRCQAPCHCVLPESMSVVTTIVTAIVLNSSEHVIAVENSLF